MRFIRSFTLSPAGGRPRGATGAGSVCLRRPVAMNGSIPVVARVSTLPSDQYPASASTCAGRCRRPWVMAVTTGTNCWTSGAAWVLGRQWGDNHGTLALASLKGQRLMFMKFDSAGRLRLIRTPAALRAFGRLRAVTRLGNGDLLVTTSNGGGDDAVLRVRSLG